MTTPTAKQTATRRLDADSVWDDGDWMVLSGRLVPPRGRPRKIKPLFAHVAEKIPFDALNSVRNVFDENEWPKEGVYVAHDSMGQARYVGRGKVFSRLRARHRQAPRELHYFSIYIVSNKNHEREIETLMIRIGGAHLHFNERKKRVDISVGSVRDYEAGTQFFVRRPSKGAPPEEE